MQYHIIMSQILAKYVTRVSQISAKYATEYKVITGIKSNKSVKYSGYTLTLLDFYQPIG